MPSECKQPRILAPEMCVKLCISPGLIFGILRNVRIVQIMIIAWKLVQTWSKVWWFKKIKRAKPYIHLVCLYGGFLNWIQDNEQMINYSSSLINGGWSLTASSRWLGMKLIFSFNSIYFYRFHKKIANMFSYNTSIFWNFFEINKVICGNRYVCLNSRI